MSIEGALLRATAAPAASEKPEGTEFQGLVRSASRGATADPQGSGAIAPPFRLAAGIVIEGTLQPPYEPETVIRPQYEAVLPPGREMNRTFFSENKIPINSAVISHHDRVDSEGAKLMVQRLVEVNPDVKIILLVDGYDATKPDAKAKLAAFYEVPQENLAPIHVNNSTRGKGPIGMFPQDGFMAGAGGLMVPASTKVRQGNQIAHEISAATGVPVARSDFIGMGGDTHFITRPDSSQVAYFGNDTIMASLDALNASRHPGERELDPGSLSDRVATIGHIMKSMNDAGIAVEDVMPVGIGRATYGEVLEAMSEGDLSRIDAAVLRRMREMADLPVPESYPTKHAIADYHADLNMATLDGVHMFVNEDDLADVPGWREQLEFFGYKPIGLPAAADRDAALDQDRLTYLNWMMGLDPAGRMTVILPTEAENRDQLSENDRRAIALIQEAVPGVRIVPSGGSRAVLYNSDDQGDVRNFGDHCRSNIMPLLLNEIEPGPTRARIEGAQ